MTLMIRNGGTYEVIRNDTGASSKHKGLWTTEQFLSGVKFALEEK